MVINIIIIIIIIINIINPISRFFNNNQDRKKIKPKQLMMNRQTKASKCRGRPTIFEVLHVACLLGYQSCQGDNKHRGDKAK